MRYTVKSAVRAHYLIKGMRSIRRALGVSPQTLTRWYQYEHFPLAKLDDGRWATTYSLIDQWVWARYLASTRKHGEIPSNEITLEGIESNKESRGETPSTPTT